MPKRMTPEKAQRMVDLQNSMTVERAKELVPDDELVKILPHPISLLPHQISEAELDILIEKIRVGEASRILVEAEETGEAV